MVDALLYEPIPYRSALEDGCTHGELQQDRFKVSEASRGHQINTQDCTIVALTDVRAHSVQIMLCRMSRRGELRYLFSLRGASGSD